MEILELFRRVLRLEKKINCSCESITSTQNKSRAWAKTGDLQSTNNDDVFVGDNILHKGRITQFATEAETPFDSIYAVKTGDSSLKVAHTRTYGIDVRNDGFLMNRDSLIAPIIQNIFIDINTGIDDLEPTTYLGATASTTSNVANLSGNKFKTAKAAIAWINRFEGIYINCIIQGTTSLNRLIINEDLNVLNKLDISFRGTPLNPLVGIAYIEFQSNGYLEVRKSHVSFVSTDVIVNQTDAIYVSLFGNFYTANSVYTFGAGISSLMALTGAAAHINISTNVVFNFSANNQVLFHCSGNGGQQSIVFSNHTVIGIVFNAGAFTGLRWAVNSPTRSLATWFVDNVGFTVPPEINMLDTVIYYGSSQALKQAVYDASCYNYPQNLGTTKPTRWTDLLPSGADLTGTTLASIVENELGEHGKLDMEWTTSTRPATPRPGQDGWNSTLSLKEYWNGSIWVSY